MADIDEEIIFGQRKQQTIENSISGTYNFNSFHALNLTFRNYWSTVTYNQDLFTLLEDGSVTTSNGHNLNNIGFDPNANFNTWNIDLKYSLEFALVCHLSALYRNSLFNSDSFSCVSYFFILVTLFNLPFELVFSFLLFYYFYYFIFIGVFL